jgi:hypothetical protein
MKSITNKQYLILNIVNLLCVNQTYKFSFKYPYFFLNKLYITPLKKINLKINYKQMNFKIHIFFYECRFIGNAVGKHNSQYHLQILYCISKARCIICFKHLQAYISLLKCSMFNVMPAPCKPGEKYLKWVEVSPGYIPPNSVQGEEEQGVPVYVCRSKHDGGVIPGKINKLLPICFLPWNDEEFNALTYEVGL